MIIRPAQLDEARCLGSLGLASWQASAFGAHDNGRTDPATLEDEFTQFCDSFAPTILVAEDQGELLGWGAREFEDERVTDLWIAPKWQSRGAGAALLAALEVAIAKQGYAYAELETFADNEGAVRFYLRQGYEPVWRGIKFSASLNYDLDKIRFRKPLRDAA